MADKNNAIVFRAYLAWAGSSNSRFTWLILQNGTENEIPDASGSFKAYDSPVIIRLEVNGTQYSTIVNGFSVKSFSDNTFASGGTGIRAVNFEFKLDAFIVEKLP
jgi:hypothetical protein